jgi:hypothetical protein
MIAKHKPSNRKFARSHRQPIRARFLSFPNASVRVTESAVNRMPIRTCLFIVP